MRYAAGALGALVLLSACEGLTPTEPVALPQVLLDEPIDGDTIPFNVPFSLRGVARAPEGGTLAEAEIVLSSAAYERRTVPLSGTEAEIEVELTVARDTFRGTDRLPLDVVVAATAVVGSRTVRSEPRGVSLVVVDQSAPEVTISFSPGVPPPDGFDAAFDAGVPFTVNVTAEDPVGGIDTITIDLPPFAGGPRIQSFGGDRRASSAVSMRPPRDLDFEITVTVGDIAMSPNVTTRTARVRVGAGGTDETPPSVRFVTAPFLECGTTSSVAVRAVDDGVGVDRIELITPDGSIDLFEPGRADPTTFTATAAVAAPRGGGVVPLSATARDYVGNIGTATSADFEVVDTLPPWFAAATPTSPSITPGGTTELEVLGGDDCGDVDVLAFALSDDGGNVRSTTVAIGTPSVDATISLPVPPDLCTLGPIRGVASLIDGGGRRSMPIRSVFLPVDAVDPSVVINTLVPPGGYMPGDIVSVTIALDDAQSGVRSATVTLDAPGLAVPSPVLVDTSTYAVTSCAGVGPRTTQISYTIPADVRFNGPTASISITAQVSDGAGRQSMATASVPVVSSAPPELRFVSPPAGTAVPQGALQVVTLFVTDASHDVDTVSLRAVGPATLAPLSTASATVAVQAASATVSFSLTVDNNAPGGAPIELIATAYDTGIPPAFATARRTLSACGAPSIARVVPDVGPLAGGTLVTLEGAGFATGMAIDVGAIGLVGVRVTSATSAVGMIPVGAYTPGVVDVTATNSCGAAMPSDVFAGGFRFVAPPSVSFVLPRVAQTAQVGDVVPVSVAAVGDGVSLASVAAGLGVLVTQPTSNVADVIDTSIVVPAGSSTVGVVGEATDVLGQVAQAAQVLTIGAPAPLALRVEAPTAVAVGETAGFVVVAETSDGRRREVTSQAVVTASNGSATVSGATVTGAAEGTVSIDATFGTTNASAVVDVVTDGIRFAHGPLLASSLSGSIVDVEILRLTAGGSSTLPLRSVALTSNAPAVVTTAANAVRVVGAGTATVTATLTSTQTATLVVTVAPTLDVLAGATVVVPSGQQFAGGTVAGTVHAQRLPAALGPWTLDAAALTIAATGSLIARGASGSAVGPGGRGGSGAGGGGAGLAVGGAPGGYGEPSGGSTVDALPASIGGDGGGPAGGQGARASADSTGAGGGSAARGANGLGTLVAVGGAPNATPGGGGGGRAGGGGGAGSVVQLTITGALTLHGVIDAGGGAGGPAVSTPGGGGGGGVVTIVASAVDGQGWIRAAGGDAVAQGGGGAVDVSQVTTRPTLLIIDVNGFGLGAILR